MARHIPRVYVSQALQPGATLQLEDGAAHHLLRVLRIQPNAPLVLFNGEGGEYTARVITASRQSLEVAIDQHQQADRESSLQLTLLQGIARGDHMDYCISKAVELGVTQIQPLRLARSQGMPVDRLAKKQAHWQAIAQSAAEQSGRTLLPQVAGATTLPSWLQASQHFDIRLLLHPGTSESLRQLPQARTIALLVGPEGGLDQAEVDMAVAAGFTTVSLGPRILRTETAAIAALTLLQAQCGDLLKP